MASDNNLEHVRLGPHEMLLPDIVHSTLQICLGNRLSLSSSLRNEHGPHRHALHLQILHIVQVGETNFLLLEKDVKAILGEGVRKFRYGNFEMEINFPNF